MGFGFGFGNIFYDYVVTCFGIARSYLVSAIVDGVMFLYPKNILLYYSLSLQFFNYFAHDIFYYISVAFQNILGVIVTGGLILFFTFQIYVLNLTFYCKTF